MALPHRIAMDVLEGLEILNLIIPGAILTRPCFMPRRSSSMPGISL